MRGLPLGTLLRYKDLPMLAKIIARRTAIAHTPKPKSHPWLVLIHTIIVTPSIAPMVMLNKNQLKKLDNWDASLGSFSSNWSAPNDGKEALTPLVPNAIRYRPAKSIAAWLPSAPSHWSGETPLQGLGLRWWKWAWTVRRPYPWKTQHFYHKYYLYKNLWTVVQILYIIIIIVQRVKIIIMYFIINHHHHVLPTPSLPPSNSGL